VRDVLRDRIERAMTIAFRIANLLADFVDRSVLPRHLARCELPLWRTGYASERGVRILMTRRAHQTWHALIAVAANDWRIVSLEPIALRRRVATWMTVRAPRIEKYA
jgi:hypothetical protein